MDFAAIHRDLNMWRQLCQFNGALHMTPLPLQTEGPCHERYLAPSFRLHALLCLHEHTTNPQHCTMYAVVLANVVYQIDAHHITLPSPQLAALVLKGDLSAAAAVRRATLQEPALACDKR